MEEISKSCKNVKHGGIKFRWEFFYFVLWEGRGKERKGERRLEQGERVRRKGGRRREEHKLL